MQLRNFMKSIIGGSLIILSTVSEAWTVTSDFDNEADGSWCSVIWNSGTDIKISTEESSSGGKSCRMGVAAGGSKIGGGVKFPKELVEGDELWLKFRIFFQNGFDFTATQGSHLKFIRVDLFDSSASRGRYDWYLPHRIILENWYNCGGYQTCSDDIGGYPATGQWVTYEIYIKYDSTPVDGGGTGRSRIWQNGKLLGDMTKVPTWADKTVHPTKIAVDSPSIRFIDHWNGGSPKTQHLYIDDFVMTSDTPSNRDAAGNPYIGVGDFAVVADPLPPKMR